MYVCMYVRMYACMHASMYVLYATWTPCIECLHRRLRRLCHVWMTVNVGEVKTKTSVKQESNIIHIDAAY